MINKLNSFFYKLGVMCGSVLYTTYKFDNFEQMIEKATAISNKYKSDMMSCLFVIQAFKDNSYDFDKSCFYQITVYVKDIQNKKTDIMKAILKEYEELGV